MDDVWDEGIWRVQSAWRMGDIGGFCHGEYGFTCVGTRKYVALISIRDNYPRVLKTIRSAASPLLPLAIATTPTILIQPLTLSEA